MKEVVRGAREETGITTSTLTFYVTSRPWRPKNRGLRTTAKVLARSLDEYLRGNVALAMDIIAGRLRSLVHVDLTGRWKEAEQLAAERTKDIGLTSGRDLYEARKHAKLINLVNSSSSEGESDSPLDTKPRVPKKKRKRGKKPKKKVEEKDK